MDRRRDRLSVYMPKRGVQPIYGMFERYEVYRVAKGHLDERCCPSQPLIRFRRDRTMAIQIWDCFNETP